MLKTISSIKSIQMNVLKRSGTFGSNDSPQNIKLFKMRIPVPSFTQPKPKTNLVCFLRDFINLNQRLKR